MRRRRWNGFGATFAALAIFVALIPPALANHEQNGYDPVVQTPEVWRGWVATEEHYTHAEGEEIRRGWWGDGSHASTAASWSADAYRSHDRSSYCTGSTNYTGVRGEYAGFGTGTGSTSIGPESAFPSWMRLPFKDEDEGFLLTIHDSSPAFAMPGVSESCDGTQSHSSVGDEGLIMDTRGGRYYGVLADLSDVPMKLSGRVTWPRDSETTVTMQVCLSRSKLDSDGDGLPDNVDLDPQNAASLTDLGIPGGPPYETIPAKLDGGPSGKRGVPLCPGTEPEPEVPDIVKKYAPQVVLHPEEQHWPMSIDDFITGSELRWAHNSGCRDHREAARGTVDSARVGANATRPYKHTNAGNLTCRHKSKRWSTKQFTRPRDKSFDRNGLEKGEGFFLDLDDDLRHGTPSTSADANVYEGSDVHYDYDEDAGWIRYYFMYGWSEMPGGTDDSDPWCCHEGEWEGISIKLDDAGEPVEAFYNAHHGGVRINWADVELVDETHPVVYAAEGAHAGYPRAGRWHIGKAPDDRTDTGRVWQTWVGSTLLTEARREPWWGFMGAWGGVEPTRLIPALDAIGGGSKNFVGPLGPSRHFRETPYECSPYCFPHGTLTFPDGWIPE